LMRAYLFFEDGSIVVDDWTTEVSRAVR
jgi:hypothetical protein